MNFKYVYFIIILFLLTTCFQHKVIESKYREKNPVDSLMIDSINGNIDIIGWKENFIEIYTMKRIISGLQTDINQVGIDFFINDRELNIVTKIPDRINGKIDIKIYIPYSLFKVNLNSKAGEISISKFLGNIELEKNNGNINIDFYGSILRINSGNSELNLNIKSNNYSDIVINNQNGDIICNVETIGKDSFLDIISFKGNINLNISKNVPHELLVFNKTNSINLYYEIIKENLSNKSFLKGMTNQNINFLKVFIDSDNGIINLNRLKK